MKNGSEGEETHLNRISVATWNEKHAAMRVEKVFLSSVNFQTKKLQFNQRKVLNFCLKNQQKIIHRQKTIHIRSSFCCHSCFKKKKKREKHYPFNIFVCQINTHKTEENDEEEEKLFSTVPFWFRFTLKFTFELKTCCRKNNRTWMCLLKF